MYTFEYLGPCIGMERITPGNTATGSSSKCLTYQEFFFTFTGGGTLTPLVGNWIKGATSSATAMIVKIGTLTGGSWAGGDAAGTLYVASVSGTFNGSENISVVGTADDMTMSSVLKAVPDGAYTNELMRGWTARAAQYVVLSNSQLMCFDGSIPDQTQLIGVPLSAGQNLILKDPASIKNWYTIDYVSGSAGIVLCSYYTGL